MCVCIIIINLDIKKKGLIYECFEYFFFPVVIANDDEDISHSISKHTNEVTCENGISIDYCP